MNKADLFYFQNKQTLVFAGLYGMYYDLKF